MVVYKTLLKTYCVKSLHEWIDFMYQTSQVSIPRCVPFGGHLIRVIPTKIFRLARAHNDTLLWNEVLVSNCVVPHLITIVEVKKACVIAGIDILEFHDSIWIYEYVAN